jgi:hypothetical protein
LDLGSSIFNNWSPSFPHSFPSGQSPVRLEGEAGQTGEAFQAKTGQLERESSPRRMLCHSSTEMELNRI